jgi:hypothetical protein
MIASRRIVQGLYRIVLSRDLLQKVCSFSADHALEREKEKWKPIFRPHSALITFIILDGFNPKS